MERTCCGAAAAPTSRRGTSPWQHASGTSRHRAKIRPYVPCANSRSRNFEAPARVHTRPGSAEHLTPTSPQNQLGRLVMAACSLVLVSRRAARRAIAVRLFAAVVWGEGALQRHQPSSLRDPRPRKAHARSGGAALPPEDLAGPTAMHAPPLGRQDVRSGTHPIPRRCCSPVRCRYHAAGLAYRRRSPLGQSPVGATGAPPRSIRRTVR